MKRCILMGDVTDSRANNARIVYSALKSLTDDAGKAFAGRMLSPLTVTLGDEFQGILADISTGCDIIFWFQDQRLKRNLPFHIHFSLVRGDIETPINPEIAHGMLGEGLAHARELLTRKDRARPRYQVDVGLSCHTRMFNDLFSVLEGLEDRWSERDFELILAMLSSDSDADVGEAFQKDRSQIWRRRKTLLTTEYSAVRSAIRDLATLGEDRQWAQ